MNIQILVIIGIIVIALLVFVVFRSRSSKKGQAAVSKKDQLKVDNNQVYIGNLSYAVTENDLRSFFQPYGIVGEVRIVRNTKTGRSKGFAFITYKNMAEANQALAAHGKPLQGRRLVVRIAKARI